MNLLADPQVTVTTVETTTSFDPCANCDAPDGHIGVYWTTTDAPTGLLYVCDHRDCINFAIREALDDAPDDSPVQVEYEQHPDTNVLGVAA